MANANHLFIGMLNYLGEEKRNVRQFFLTAQHTITELYKSDNYIEQLKAIIIKLENLYASYEKLKKESHLDNESSKEYVKTINDISTELHFLKATNFAMEENLNEIIKSERFQHKISGSMQELKKKINSQIIKAERILSP